MKRLLLTIILIQCFSNLFAWEGSVKLIVHDNTGRKDSVIFGISESSTLGIDTILGEKNIFNLAFDSLDIRVIQRDSTNHICGGFNYSSNVPQNLYYPTNSDSKIDFRPFSGFSSLNNNFEIYIHAIEFPITLIAEYSGITGSTADLMANFYFLDNNCQTFKDEYANPDKDTLAIINDNTFTTLVINIDHEVGINDYEKNDNWSIFPNPSNSIFTISSETNFNGTLRIIDINGKLLKSILVEDKNEFQLDMSEESQGMYLINYMDKKTGLKTIRKLIKN
jgi:hypothetical protein